MTTWRRASSPSDTVARPSSSATVSCTTLRSAADIGSSAAGLPRSVDLDRDRPGELGERLPPALPVPADVDVQAGPLTVGRVLHRRPGQLFERGRAWRPSGRRADRARRRRCRGRCLRRRYDRFERSRRPPARRATPGRIRRQLLPARRDSRRCPYRSAPHRWFPARAAKPVVVNGIASAIEVSVSGSTASNRHRRPRPPSRSARARPPRRLSCRRPWTGRTRTSSGRRRPSGRPAAGGRGSHPSPRRLHRDLPDGGAGACPPASRATAA